jgi:hypothetical protein
MATPNRVDRERIDFRELLFSCSPVIFHKVDYTLLRCRRRVGAGSKCHPSAN